MHHLLFALAIGSALLTPATALADPDSYRDHPPPPPSYGAPPLPAPPPYSDGPPLPPPGPVVNPVPPPLSPTMRAIYAPFYAAGVVLHYGWYYAVEAPIEVFQRALSFGVDAGHDDPQ